MRKRRAINGAEQYEFCATVDCDNVEYIPRALDTNASADTKITDWPKRGANHLRIKSNLEVEAKAALRVTAERSSKCHSSILYWRGAQGPGGDQDNSKASF